MINSTIEFKILLNYCSSCRSICNMKRVEKWKMMSACSTETSQATVNSNTFFERQNVMTMSVLRITLLHSRASIHFYPNQFSIILWLLLLSCWLQKRGETVNWIIIINIPGFLSLYLIARVTRSSSVAKSQSSNERCEVAHTTRRHPIHVITSFS